MIALLCKTIPLSSSNPKVILSTYILDDSLQFDTGKKRPAILIFPGGGYTFTSDREAEFVALEFAARGFHAFVLRYSVGVAALVPAPILDGFSAIACIRDHTVEWNIDPDRLVVCGFSAGGHLASGMMTMWKDAATVEAMGRPAQQLRPDAGILCYALLQLPFRIPPSNTGVPADQKQALIAKMESEMQEPQHPDWTKAIFEEDGLLWLDTAAIAYLNCFGTLQPDRKQLQDYSTVLRVDEDTPPAFLWCTTPDDIVPASNSVVFTAAMMEHGRPVELHLFGSGGHGLSLAKVTTGSPDDLHPAGEWFKLATRWLDEVLKAPEQVAGSPFAREKQKSSQQVEDAEKPTQYYKNIFDDRASMFRHVPFSLEQEIVRHVIDGNEVAALEVLNKIYKQGRKAVLAEDPLRSQKNSMICFCTFLTRAAIQAGVTDEEAFALSDASIQHIETLRNQKAAMEYEPRMLLQFIGLVKKRQNKSYSLPVRKAIHYIASNLEKPLQLSAIAEYANVHPNYLCRRFKQETGSTLSSYAISRRIHESTYFVQHTDYSMAEIAALYGFSSQSHFISTFKKVLLVSPGEYRNQSRNP